jgi:hypothetical protein
VGVLGGPLGLLAVAWLLVVAAQATIGAEVAPVLLA